MKLHANAATCPKSRFKIVCRVLNGEAREKIAAEYVAASATRACRARAGSGARRGTWRRRRRRDAERALQAPHRAAGASAQPPSRGLGQTVGSASATHAAELLHQRLAGLSIRPRGGSQCNAVGERGPGRSQAFAS
jgi:hypothetical protein